MNINLNTIKMLLLKVLYAFTITLFCVLITDVVRAAGFEYKDFNWDKFYEIRKEYWSNACKADESCDDTSYINSQKQYYTKLYKVLAKYDNKGLHINDNAIIETSFFGTQPSYYSDNGEYKRKFQSILDFPHLFDGTDDVNVEDTDESFEADASYYEKEKDTIKVLAKNMVAYSTVCYGIYGSATANYAEDNSVTYSCDEGSVTTINGAKKCVDKIATNELGFWEYFTSKLEHNWGKVMLFLGKHPSDEHYEECISTEGYEGGTYYTYLDDPHVSYNKYFDFLYENTFFDSRAHLNGYYQEILEDTEKKDKKVDCVSSEVCENSLESLDLLDEYDEELKEVRLHIIREIVEILHSNGQKDVNYYRLGFTVDDYEQVESEVQRKSLYWPIGSTEIETKDGVKFASEEPASTSVVSYFGERTSQITGEAENHYGIDISGEEGVTNVVAAFSGTILEIEDDCEVGDYDCNDGYGNMIVISHPNGDYSYYASLSSIEDYIKVGDSVKTGEILGTVGKTGATTAAILHFEYRINGNTTEDAVDPLDYISSSDPRPAGASGDFADGDFSVACSSLSKEEFMSKVNSYCGSTNCPIVKNESLEDTYNLSIKYGVNPEVTIIRAQIEKTTASHNYWGIGYCNGCSSGTKYSSYEDAIKDFARITTKNGPLGSQMMSTYAYLGTYWYNPGGSGLGGCYYAPYIYPNGMPERVSTACASDAPKCDKNGGSQCTLTTDEDKYAYLVYQVRAMANLRYLIFGLKGVSSCHT